MPDVGAHRVRLGAIGATGRSQISEIIRAQLSGNPTIASNLSRVGCRTEIALGVPFDGTARHARRSRRMAEDFDVFVQPGFWISLALLFVLFAATVAVIAYSSNYAVPSILG